MLPAMPPVRITFFFLAAALLAASPVHARGVIDKVQIKGLDKGDDAAIIENIEVSLSLYEAIGKEQGESRLEYLLSQAERQTRMALEPFGYYNPTITVNAPREGDATAPPDGWADPSANGTLPGIDRGWAYAPGASVADELRPVIDAKAAALPAPLGDTFRESLRALPPAPPPPGAQR